MELGFDHFESCLDQFRPQIKNYGWVWAALRARARRHNGQFPFRYYQLLKRFFDPGKPYFIGETADGTRYLGDTRELYAVVSAVEREHDTPLCSFLGGRAAQSGGAYLDIGANMGITAASVARSLGGQGSVVAFEPAPETARRAAATFALNGLTNIRLFVCALGEEDGEIEFYMAPRNSEWASTSPVGNPAIEWVKTTVPCRRLDSLRAEGAIGRVGLIKVDVEGYEPKVLAGAEGAIRAERPEIVFEYNRDIAPKIGWSAQDIVDLLERCGGYRLSVLGERAQLQPFPPPKDGGGFVNIYCRPESAAG